MKKCELNLRKNKKEEVEDGLEGSDEDLYTMSLIDQRPPPTVSNAEKMFK